MSTVTKTLGSLRLDEITLTVPLTQDPADPRTLEVFARVATAPGGEDRPYLLYLQGGPGSESPRPCLDPVSPSWLPTALERYRVVFLDQRGTGLSSPVDLRFLENRSTDEAVEYLTHLRADAIVRDAEALREELGVGRWSVLGQSFGGFTALHYLSTHSDSVEHAYFTGGLSAIGRAPEEIYATCYEVMRQKSEAYYRRFPEDRERVASLVRAAEAGEIVLPDGEVVSASRVRSLGHQLGSDDGWFALHGLLERDPRSDAFRHDLAGMMPYTGRNPLYYVLHESCYADGAVTGWAAERAEPLAFAEDPTLLTGEHVRREWLDTVPAFRPWKDVALGLAEVPWPRLYSPEGLEASGARGAAAIYVEDAYVPLEYSRRTAALMPGIKTLVTSSHEHNGLRASNGAVLRRLIGLADGTRVR